MPENTIPAMLKAIDLGVTTLEMDVVFTSDMKAILSHEPFFNHAITTKPDGTFITRETERSFNIYKMPYDSVKKYDVGMKLNPAFPKQEKMSAVKPLLTDVIDEVERYCSNKRKPYYNIETKTKPSTDNEYHPAPPQFVDELMKVITAKEISDRVIIQSFDIRTLQYLHKNYPAIKTALLIEPSEAISVNEKIKRLGFEPDIVSPEQHMVNDKLIEVLHGKNIQVIPWTVNDVESIKKFQRQGVDGIITDYPDLFKE